MYEAKRANSDDLVLTYSSELVTWHEFKISFLTKAYFITSDTHILKIRLIADVIVEIFKIKYCSVGNLFKYMSCRQE